MDRGDNPLKNIGIIGGGVSSLHLGFTLLDEGLPATIYAPQTAEQIAAGRMQNTVAHMPDTIERERALGIDFWSREEVRTCNVRHYSLRVEPGKAVDFSGGLNGDERVIDYRVYLPRLMQAFTERGGRLVHQAVTPDDLDTLCEAHDLLAIGSGKSNGGFADFFSPIPELSLHAEPPRVLCVGTFTGVNDRDPLGVTVGISPGNGEIIALPMETAYGSVMALLFECRSDGELADLPGLDYNAGNDAFNERILEALADHYPTLHAHVDQNAFGLSSDNDLIQGSFRPVTRRSWAELRPGKFAIAIGDLRCTQDPLTGQGANLASRGACSLGQQIVGFEGQFDEAFCIDHEEQTRYQVAGTVGFNNAMLDPQAHTQKLLGVMAANEAVCTDFSTRFRAPHTIWFDILKDAATCDSYLAGFAADAA